MIRVPLKNIVRPTHLSVFAFSSFGSNARVRMDVFSGWLGVNFRGDGGSVHRDDCKSFLVTASKDVFTLGTEAELIAATVTVTPSSVADDDDEANVAAVDSASVRLEKQAFPAISGNPLCLVLRAKLAALNVTLHGVTYQVVVLSKPREPDNEKALFISGLDDDTKPA